jgi:hypothetical protein
MTRIELDERREQARLLVERTEGRGLLEALRDDTAAGCTGNLTISTRRMGFGS